MQMSKAKKIIVTISAALPLLLSIEWLGRSWSLLGDPDFLLFDDSGFFGLVLDISFVFSLITPVYLGLIILGIWWGKRLPIILGAAGLAVMALERYVFSNIDWLIFGLTEFFWRPPSIPVIEIFVTLAEYDIFSWFAASQSLMFITLVLTLFLAIIPSSSKKPSVIMDQGQVSTEYEEVEYPSSSPFCDQCGARIAPDSKFCGECGSPAGQKYAGTGAQATRYGQQGLHPKTNTLAIVSLVISFFIPIVGMVLAYMSRKEIDSSMGSQTGRGLTTAAIVLNWIWIVSALMLVLTGILLFAAAG